MSSLIDGDSGVGFLMNDVTRLLRRNFDRRVQGFGLTQAQWRAIAYIARSQGLNQSALAQILEVRPITLTRLVDRMAAAGWVERRPDPLDRRAVRLFLTDKAEPIFAEMRRLATRMLDEAMAGLGTGEREALIGALRLMKHNLVEAEAGEAANGAAMDKAVARASGGR